MAVRVGRGWFHDRAVTHTHTSDTNRHELTAQRFIEKHLPLRVDELVGPIPIRFLPYRLHLTERECPSRTTSTIRSETAELPQFEVMTHIYRHVDIV